MRALVIAVMLLGALLLLAASAFPASPDGTIRVAIFESARAVELRGDGIQVSPLEGCRCSASVRVNGGDVVRVVPKDGVVEVDGAMFGRGARLSSERAIRLNGREYSGMLEILKNGDGLAVVNELPLEDYVAGALKAEASEQWPIEMLRAQAIVVRTYAAYHRRLNATKPYHIVASTIHQQYAGRVAGGSRILEAARDTSGQVLLWESELFPAFYHTDSGGYTEDPRNVFAARNMPPLRPVRHAFATSSPYAHWNLDLRLSDLTETLRRGGISVGRVIGLEVVERSPSLRVVELLVRGTNGTARVRGADLRRLVGYDTLRSTLFAVAVDEEHARFSGRGWGHGAGLCQWGAKGMAAQGYMAPEILAFFYRGATLSTLPE